MSLFGADHRWGGGGGAYGPFPKTCRTYPTSDETWHSHTLPKKDPKNIRIT